MTIRFSIPLLIAASAALGGCSRGRDAGKVAPLTYSNDWEASRELAIKQNAPLLLNFGGPW